MNDTPPQIDQLYRNMLLQRSGEERFMMACDMFETARTMILASLSKNLTEEERRSQLCSRLYGKDLLPPLASGDKDGPGQNGT